MCRGEYYHYLKENMLSESKYPQSIFFISVPFLEFIWKINLDLQLSDSPNKLDLIVQDRLPF